MPPAPARTRRNAAIAHAGFAGVGLLGLLAPPADLVPPALGVLGGCGLAAAGWHPYRVLGLVPVAAAVLLGAVVLASPAGFAFAVALGLGAVTRHVVTTPGRAIFPPQVVLFGGAAGVFVANLGVRGTVPADEFAAGVGVQLAVAAALLSEFCGVFLFRPLFELGVVPVLGVGYRVRPAGPLPADFPMAGPVLVIANHACWWDPLFLAKVLPRPITPMMTSLFYDRWFLRPLMVGVFDVIRVTEAALRREAPELRDAVAALDAGHCVLIFPEGYLRRKESEPLRRFGRGAGEILKARPDTPVVACWIEGGWGSFTSFFNGPPRRNKPRTYRRPITVAMAAPDRVPAAVLADHNDTRTYLRERVLAVRETLGLPAVAAGELETP